MAATKSTSAHGRSAIMRFSRIVASGDVKLALRMLEEQPELATARIEIGASRAAASEYFLKEISHYVYAGDTALHVAAASHQPELVGRLLELGADPAARNRRGAQPLHYAADTNFRDVQAQADTIRRLCRAGAEPNALDQGGVAPIHRAVRTRSAPAIEALVESGADATLENKSGSTPLHLAVQNTGRGGSGSQRAIEQQTEIIRLLLSCGAEVTARDARGRSVLEAAQSDRVREVLAGYAR